MSRLSFLPHDPKRIVLSMNASTGRTAEARSPLSSLPLDATLAQVESELSNSASNPAKVAQALGQLLTTLHQLRLSAKPDQWQTTSNECQKHPLASLLRTDPFTARALEKPRGYAGDASMMDLIYSVDHPRFAPNVSGIGCDIFKCLVNRPACRAVRERRATIARYIDDLAEKTQLPHILSVGAGHLREAALAAAVRDRRVGRLVALDADSESLHEVKRSYGDWGVETRVSSFQSLLRPKSDLGQFDLVYSLGLFDYLSERAAIALVRAMFQMLRPSGSLIVANFLQGIQDTGYMEAFMDWKLIYRTRGDMITMTAEIPEDQIESVELWSEQNRNIIFLRVKRAAVPTRVRT